MNEAYAPTFKESARSFTYIIPHEPVSWKRPGGTTVRYDTQKDIRLMWGIYLRNQHEGPYFSGPLHLGILFGIPIPKRNSQKKREALHGKYTENVPDVSNCLKLIEDIAQGICYGDDKIIAAHTTARRYDLNPRIEFTITELR